MADSGMIVPYDSNLLLDHLGVLRGGVLISTIQF